MFCTNKSFSSHQKQLEFNVYSYTRVLKFQLYIRISKKLNQTYKCNHIEVLLQRDFRLKV